MSALSRTSSVVFAQISFTDAFLLADGVHDPDEQMYFFYCF